MPAPLFGLAQPLCLRFFTEAVTTLPPPFSDLPFLSLLFACVLDASVLPYHWPLLLRSLAFFCSACFLLSLSPFLSLLSLCLTLPLGVVPGLSGRRLVRISSATLTSLFLLFRLPSLARPSHFSSFKLFQGGTSGRRLVRVSLRCFSLSFQLSTVSGRRLVQGCCVVILIHGTPYDSKQSRPGLNLTTMHSSMTFWSTGSV